jgi:SAM-dependent methyltransferase/uncharacterized protein YbaR (Trm112 family)
MLRGLLETVPLVCPACLAAEEKKRPAPPPLALGAVDEEAGGDILQGTLACTAEVCGREFPILDGIPILVDDVLRYCREERPALMRRSDLSARNREVLDLPLEDDDEDRLRGRDLESYLGAHYGRPEPALAPLAGALRRWVEDALDRFAPGPPARRARPRLGLDAGCAAGGFTLALAEHVDQAVGIDVAFDLLRAARREAALRAPGAVPAFAVGTVEEPPFRRGAFDVAIALNVIDAIMHPRRALRRLEAALRPGGLLLIATPFAYASARTEPAERILEEEIVPFLDGSGPDDALSPGFDVLEDVARLPWVIPVAARHHDVYMVRCIALRRRAPRRRAHP